MSILNTIIADKRREITLKKSIISTSQLESYSLFNSETISMSKHLRQSHSGIIAEHKRRSPSQPIINFNQTVENIVLGYQNAGVCGISILTDGKYFGGSLDDLIIAKATSSVPLLRKEFIIDEYQIIEAKANGADVILLIAAILTREEIKRFSLLAQSLGLEVLLEIHNEEELYQSMLYSINMIGVNNRDLKSFTVSTEISKKLAAKIPDDFIKVSESGISTIETVKELKQFGYKGFLMGECFMKTSNPGLEVKSFIQKLIS
jgi:indole-3-glycerol phosphate synthase